VCSVNRNRSDSPALWQEQSLPQSPTTRPDQSHRRVLPGPARLQVHTAEAGESVHAGKAVGVFRNTGRRLQPDDGRVRQLCHSEVLRVRHARTEIYAGAESMSFPPPFFYIYIFACYIRLQTTTNVPDIAHQLIAKTLPLLLGTRTRIAVGAADVRLQGHSESAGERRRRTTSGNRTGAGRPCPQMR